MCVTCVHQAEPPDFSGLCRKFGSLIQTQARDLSHLRQRVREARGVCSILTQHLGDTTKAFEELLRSNDIDFYMGQSFREQLAQSGALVQRVSAKISGRESRTSQLRTNSFSHTLNKADTCKQEVNRSQQEVNICFQQEMIPKIQRRRRNYSPSGQCVCECVSV